MSTSGKLFDHIPLLRPWLGEEEVAALAEVVASGWITQGPVVAEFEREVANLIGAQHAVATNAATSALHLSLIVSGIEPGDEVICPATTCMATANAICHAGAVAAFADVDPRTFNLDPEDVERRLGPKTRAIMLVHQIGLPAEIEVFADLARRHGLVLIEDAATAFGSKHRGQFVGSHGRPTCFSFHPRKMITTGEGGMMLTASSAQAERARALRATGASISDLDRHRARGVLQQQYDEVGYNYRMTDLQAAIGRVQLRRFPSMLQQRREQAAFYDRNLAELPGVLTPYQPPGSEHCFSSYCIRLGPPIRLSVQEVLESMAAKGVSCRRGIPPLYRENYFRRLHPDLVLPGCEEVDRTSLFLPIFPGLSEEGQRRVVEALRDTLA